MEVHSAKDVFGNCGPQTQCGLIWRKAAHKTSPADAQGLRRALQALADGFWRRVRKFRTAIATRKCVGPTAISNSLVLGLVATNRLPPYARIPMPIPRPVAGVSDDEPEKGMALLRLLAAHGFRGDRCAGSPISYLPACSAERASPPDSRTPAHVSCCTALRGFHRHHPNPRVAAWTRRRIIVE